MSRLEIVPYNPRTGRAIATGEVPVWDDATGWRRSSEVPIGINSLAGYPNDAAKVLHGDGTWTLASNAGQEQAYNPFTTPVTVTGLTEGTATTVAAATAFNTDGTSAYLIEFFAPRVFAPDTGGADLIAFALYDGASSIGILGEISQHSTVTGSTDNGPVSLSCRLIPAAALKNYSVRAWVSSTTGTPQVEAGAGGAGNQVPGFIRVTKAT